MVSMTTLDKIASTIAAGKSPGWLREFLSNWASGVSAAIAIEKMRLRKIEMRAGLNEAATAAASLREILQNDFVRESEEPPNSEHRDSRPDARSPPTAGFSATS